MPVVRRASLCVLLAAVTTLVAGCGENTVTVKTVREVLPTPVPSVTPSPVQQAVPAVTPPESYEVGDSISSGGDVSGGGPTEDAAAVARIEAQFPVIQGDYVLGGDDALGYIDRLGNVIPGLPQMAAVTKVSRCAFEYGIVGAKLYITPDFSRAGAIVVISHSQMRQLALLAARCFLKDVTGGGDEFSPCFEAYTIENTFENVPDRFSIFVGGTNHSFCTTVRAVHQNFIVD